MHPRHTLIAMAVLGIPLSTGPARAQVPDSVLFHRGQWGTEFTVGSGFAAAGLLHFTSPTRALLLDFSLGVDHGTSTSDRFSGTTDGFGGSVQVGTRTYHSLGSRLYRMTTLGLTANYQWHRTAQNAETWASESFGGGVFGDVGASWLVTPHLALGAKYGVTLTYWYTRSSGAHGSQLSFTGGQGTLVGQLYF